MSRSPGRVIFGLWFGLFLPPLTIFALVLAFARHWAIGVLTLGALTSWVVATSRATCCRCWAYGTAGCGLPGLVAPLFGRRKPPGSLSRSRIRLHFALDVGVAAFLHAWYLWLCPAVFPVVVAWTVGAWLLVGRRKQYHGLLHRLKTPAPDGHGRISLPVVR
jgi:hypothetical protein